MSDADHPNLAQAERRATSPVAGAIAGMLFAVLFTLSYVIMASTVTDIASDTGSWLQHGVSNARFAIGLLPFAGLFFLWFIAVARQRLGTHEDQFFATVFLGSGLLFLAMMFSAAASAGAILASYVRSPVGFAGSATYLYARDVLAEVFNVYALRMAGVFQVSAATLWMRTRVMPRWIALGTYAVACVLLFGFSQSRWLLLLLPGWVLLVSAYIIVTRRSTP